MKKIFLSFIFVPVFLLADIQFPSPSGWVVDEAHLLSGSTVKEIWSKSEALSKRNGPEVVVVTIQSIAPYDIETYSIRLAEKWKVGKKGKDNGIIEILALRERKVRIEVGRGLEGILNDAKAGQIISNMTPYLKSGDYDGGLKLGFNQIINQITREK